jgi:hypothetical protein
MKISRRAVLRGLGAAVSLPLLDVTAPTPASAAAKPVNRLAYLFFPNGFPRGAWEPAKIAEDGRLLELNEWMSPLEPFKEDIVIPTNLWNPLGNGHVKGPPTWLTGWDYDELRVNAGGVSIDQLVAKHAGQETLLPSLELSLKGEGFMSNSLPRNSISWAAGDRPLSREIEPRAVFDRMFRPPSGGASDRSVMDMVLAEAKSLREYVSNADRQRLDEYFEAIRTLEKRIAFADKQTSQMRADKARTDTLTTPTPGIPAGHEHYMRIMMDLVVLAFQSDATRVCTFMLDHEQSNRYFNFIADVRGTWHALSHYRDASGKTRDDDKLTSWDSVEQKRAMFASVQRWHHRQMAYFLGRLKQIREPNGGTLLDNSMIVYGSSLGDGHEHDKHNLPIMLAGRGCGSVRTGRQITYREPTNLAGLHISLAQRMGLKIDKFATCDRALDELAG